MGLDAAVYATSANDNTPLESLPPASTALAPLPTAAKTDDNDKDRVYIGDLPDFHHYARAEFDRAPENDDELALKEGALLCVIDTYEDGWGSAFFPSPPFTPGAFPLNHVQDVAAVVESPHTPDPDADNELQVSADEQGLIVVR